MAVVLAAIGLVLAGCAETNEVRTQASSDGLRAELGGLLLSNLMVLAAGEGKPDTVLGAVANHAEGTVTVSIGVAGETRAETFEVAEEATVLLGPEECRVRLHGLPEPPGAVIALEIVSDRDGATTRRVPILDATLDCYRGLVPSPSSN